MQKTTVQIDFESPEWIAELYGQQNKNLAAIEEATRAKIHTRGAQISITGHPHDTEIAANLIRQLYTLIKANYPVYPADISYAIRILEKKPSANLKEIFLDQVYITGNKRIISPKSLNQKTYIDAIKENDIVFGIGPAGTGKTYLAVAMAVAAYTKNIVHSIILTRPAVEAGEKLGYLPGDLAQKIDPYLRPLYDALNDMLGREKAAMLIEQQIIEVAPLAFMRGRTLNNAFIILDEAQNTTQEQMKMFLTRLGFDSKAVITGDVTQVDLPGSQQSGLVHANRILKKIKGINFSYFNETDVVRHQLVQEIIKAYSESGKRPQRKR